MGGKQFRGGRPRIRNHGCDPGVNRMSRLVQGDGRDDWDLVLRSAICLAARQFSA